MFSAATMSLTKIGSNEARPSITVHQLDPRAMYYAWGATQIQVRNKASGVVVYDSGDVASLSASIGTALEPATEYEWRAIHKEAAGYWPSGLNGQPSQRPNPMPAIYLQHPDHGTHIVYDESEVIRHEKLGWSRRDKQDDDQQPVKRKPGRPKKADA